MPIAVVFGADRPWRLACADAMRAAGYQVRVASGLAELAKALGASRDAVVILDPVGVDTTSALRLPPRALAREANEDGGQTANRALARWPVAE